MPDGDDGNKTSKRRETMKRVIVLGMGLVLLVCGMLGCSGLEGVKNPRLDTVDLDQWLEGYAFRKILDEMKTNSFMKDFPFLIVRTEGEATGRVIGHRIDSLTEEIRERMITFFLEFPEIRVIRRHPVSVMDHPYTLQELKCGRFVEPRILLTIDIRRLGKGKDRLARVTIRAMDLEKGEWIRGFSLHQVVALSRAQSADLSTVHPDQYLQGLKYVPFAFSQRDEMGAYLARNLSCMFSETYDGEAFRVFVDVSKTIGKERDIAWFIKKQLQFCNEIQVTNSRENADWILVVESRKTGTGTGLSQSWIEVYRMENGDLVRGLATYAYFLSPYNTRFSLAGTWKIVNLPEGSISGFMRITGDRDHGPRGDLFGPDGVSLIKRGIFIQVKDQNVDWAFYDDRIHRTLKARGLLIQEGKKMSVKVTPFPSDGRFMFQEFILEEVR